MTAMASAPLRVAVILVVVLAAAPSRAVAAAAHPPRDDGPHARHLLSAVRPRSSAAEQGAAASDLVRRLLPDHFHLFRLSVDPGIGPEHRDTFTVLKTAGSPSVNVTGTSGVAAAWGLHHYLTQHCGCHVSWDHDQLRLPADLPQVNLTITSVERYRYYQNVCTTSYSFVWWDWERWQRELDWMALNGINLALAFTGQEAVWRSVYLQLGLSKQDVDQHFTGPAFLAWLRMGNMRGWTGPLPASWFERSRLLQHRILARMRQLGIVPVLPAFAGHVPTAFHRLFPNASTTPLERWNNFPDEYCCPLLLDPTDPLFHRVGTLFVRELTAQFGTDHIYNSDTFNEMRPSDGRPEYLAQVGKAIYGTLVDVDPKAVWMIQNWLFVHDALFWTEPRAKALLTSVPTGRLLVLDLMAELHPQYRRLQSYYGQPFVWCMLHNFGGTLGLYGAISNVNRNVFEARALDNSTMVGTGLTMEGTGQNYVMYDFVNEFSWRKEPANLTAWFTQYMVRRYGHYHPAANDCWQLLKDSVYNFNQTWKNHGRHIIVRHPSLRLKPLGSVYDNKDPLYSHHGRFVLTLHPTLDLQEPVWYRVEAVRDAWRALLDAGRDAGRDAAGLEKAANYRHDLVDLSRQGLQLAAAVLYKQVVRAFNRKQRDALRASSAQMTVLFGDLEAVLRTDAHFMLGPWLSMARRRATSELEERVYEWGARNQLTLWGPRGEIKDYAAKQWSGLVAHYYKPRWQRFLDALDAALGEGGHWNQTAVSKDILANVEEPFTLLHERYPTEPSGDSLQVSRDLYSRWSHLLTSKSLDTRRRSRPSCNSAALRPLRRNANSTARPECL